MSNFGGYEANNQTMLVGASFMNNAIVALAAEKNLETFNPLKIACAETGKYYDDTDSFGKIVAKLYY